METNTNAAGVMMNAGPLFGISSGITALVAVPNPEARFITCAVMFAVAAGSAMSKYLSVAPAQAELADYPSDTRTTNPWERDGGPAGL